MSTTSNPKRKAATILSLGVLCASIFTAGIAGATEPSPATPTTPTTVTSSLVDESPSTDSSPLEPGTLDADEDAFSDWEPTEEEIAEINAEVAELTEALTEAGISFTIETDEFGLQYPEWAEADDEQAWEILEDVFGDMLIDDTDFDDTDFDWQPTADEVAEINAEIAKEVEALEAAGVAITMETDEFGISFPTWDENDDETAMAVFDELYGPFEDFDDADFEDFDFEDADFEDADFDDFDFDDFDFDDADFDDADFDDADWEPAAKNIAEINELIKSEIKALTDAGISFTLETDEFGFEYPMWDATDDDAAWDALESLWEAEFELVDGDAAGE